MLACTCFNSSATGAGQRATRRRAGREKTLEESWPAPSSEEPLAAILVVSVRFAPAARAPERRHSSRRGAWMLACPYAFLFCIIIIYTFFFFEYFKHFFFLLMLHRFTRECFVVSFFCFFIFLVFIASSMFGKSSTDKATKRITLQYRENNNTIVVSSGMLDSARWLHQ